MKFRVATTSGGEVIFEGHSKTDLPIYYGATQETGLWRICIPKFEDFLVSELANLSFGSSIEEFVFGLEIAELEEWGHWFKDTRDFMSFRPKTKQLISVGQIEWKDVKDLSIEEQLIKLNTALIVAVERIENAKRKPKDFDCQSFAATIKSILPHCTSEMVAV